jgi:hypothetical protein
MGRYVNAEDIKIYDGDGNSYLKLRQQRYKFFKLIVSKA